VVLCIVFSFLSIHYLTCNVIQSMVVLATDIIVINVGMLKLSMSCSLHGWVALWATIIIWYCIVVCSNCSTWLVSYWYLLTCSCVSTCIIWICVFVNLGSFSQFFIMFGLFCNLIFQLSLVLLDFRFVLCHTSHFVH
jgi:hypothetical protein